MLERLRLLDFKSFVDLEVALAPLTLLVGANASGKSNFLDALWLLHGLSLDLPLEVALDGEEPRRSNGEQWPGVRGGTTEASRLGTAVFEIRSSWRSLRHGEEEVPEARHRLRIQTAPVPAILLEELHAECVETGGVSAGSLLAQAENGASPARLALRRALRSLHVLSPRPERMRDYGQLKRAHLGADGANLSGALYRLCSDEDDRRDLVDWLGELLAPELVDLDFVIVEELGDVMAMFVEKGGRRISARSLSDGTLRFLALLLALRTAEPGSTFLIEEVAAGLHPSRSRLLIEMLSLLTRERELQVLATSHSPGVLQALDEEGLADAVVFARLGETEGTIAQRLGDLPHFSEVAKQRDVGELLTSGWLEMAL